MRIDRFMPGYRSPDDSAPNPQLVGNADDDSRGEYLQALKRLRQVADNCIQEITTRIDTDCYADRVTPEEVMVELEAWVEVASQITRSLIHDLLAQQSLMIEEAYEKLEDQAPALSWFQKAANFFRHATSRSHRSAKISETPAVNSDSLTPSEIALARAALADLYNILESVFCKLPDLRNLTLVRAALVTSIIFTLLPTASANAPSSLSTNSHVPSPNQVATATHPDHLSTPLPGHLSHPFTPIPTYTSPVTSPPPSPPESTVHQSQASPLSPEAPAPTPTVTTQDIIALATGGPELTPAQVNLLTQDLLASITRFNATTNAEFDANDPSLLSAINDAVTNTHPEINPLTQLPTYQVTHTGITYKIELVESDSGEAVEAGKWQVANTNPLDLNSTTYSEESMLQASAQLQQELRTLFFSDIDQNRFSQAITRELDPSADQELIERLNMTIGADFSLDFLAFSPEEQKALMPGRMLLVEPNSGLVAHSALVDLGENTTALILPYHVLEALLLVSGNNYYLCYSTSEGKKYIELTQFAASVTRNVVNPSDEAWVAVQTNQITGLSGDIQYKKLIPLIPSRFTTQHEFGMQGNGLMTNFNFHQFWNSVSDNGVNSNYASLVQNTDTPRPFIYPGYSGSPIYIMDKKTGVSSYTIGIVVRVEELGFGKCYVTDRYEECWSSPIVKLFQHKTDFYQTVYLDVRTDLETTWIAKQPQYVIVDSDLGKSSEGVTVGDSGLPVKNNYQLSALTGDNRGKFGGLFYELLLKYKD